MENKFTQSMNVFAPTEVIKGQRVLPANPNSFSGIVDDSQMNPLLPGDPVKIIADTQGLPHFVKANLGDLIVGFVEHNLANVNYPAGKICQVSAFGNVMYMEAAGALNAGVSVNITNLADVQVGAVTGDGSVLGFTMEAATAAGQLVRVMITPPDVYTANS